MEWSRERTIHSQISVCDLRDEAGGMAAESPLARFDCVGFIFCSFVFLVYFGTLSCDFSDSPWNCLFTFLRVAT